MQTNRDLFTFIHLSDIHATESINVDDIVSPLVYDIRKLQREGEIGSIDTIVISGDLVQRGQSKDEYTKATAILKRLAHEILSDLAWPSPQLVVVPGNHDVDFELCRRSLTDFATEKCERKPHRPKDPDQGFKQSVYRRKFSHFAKCLKDLTGKPWPLAWGEQVLEFRMRQPDSYGPGVVFIGLNSAFQIHHENDKAGIDPEGRAKALGIIDTFEPDKWIKIIVHHHGYEASEHGKADYIDDDSIKTILDRDVAMVLHGHWHKQKPGTRRLYGGRNVEVVAAGSLAADYKYLPAATGHEYNIITLSLNAREGAVFPRVRDSLSDPWRPDTRWSEGGQESYSIHFGLREKARILPLHTVAAEPEIPKFQIIPRGTSTQRKELFEPLLRLAERRKLVFLIGGNNSGRETFQEQCQTYVQAVHRDLRHYLVTFREDYYSALLDYWRRVQVEGGVSRHPQINSLLGSIAYEAYMQIRELAIGVDRKALDAEVPEEAFLSLRAFCQSYFRGLIIISRDPKDCVRHFLTFLDRLLGPPEKRRARITVFMPYEGLSDFLGSEVVDERKNAIKELWAALLEFTQDNWDEFGNLKQDAFISGLGQIGIIIGVSTIPLGRDPLGGEFIRHSVFALPPLSPQEISDFATQVLRVKLGDAIISEIIGATGGGPWFVRLLLGCLLARLESPESLERNHANKLVADSIADATRIIDGNLNGEAKAMRYELHDYYETLTQNFGYFNQRYDLDILKAWRSGEKFIEASPRLERWLATGLVWLNTVDRQATVGTGAFARYKRVQLQRAGALPLRLYENWRQSNSAATERGIQL